MSLLHELQKHSTLDIDCNDSAVARQYGFFQDMTSNQLLVLHETRRESNANVIKQACELATQNAGLFPGVSLSDLAVDYMTADIGFKVSAHLKPNGFIHAQTLPSLAYDAAATLAHARRLVKVYTQLGMDPGRICIKIPATREGLEACEVLGSQPKPIRTLATMCFSVAQGLKAAQSGCMYVAPYVNPLIVHIDPTKHVKYEDPLKEMTGVQVTFAIQELFDKLREKTKVLAASLVTAEEMVSLCGIHHITLSAAALSLLEVKPLDQPFEGIRDRSLQYPSGAADFDSTLPFFTADFDAAITSPEVRLLLDDAILHFLRAEVDLRGIARAGLDALEAQTA